MKKGVDYIGVGAGAIIQDGQGRLFLARRADGARNEHGRWEFPGGAVEFGETLEHALKREIYEEFGIEIQVCRLIDVIDHILPVPSSVHPATPLSEQSHHRPMPNH
jgi:mutator protein MutT